MGASASNKATLPNQHGGQTMDNNQERRVVISGMGIISPLGSSLDDVWASLIAGNSGIGPLQRVPTAYLPTAYGAEARQFTGHIDDFGPLEPSRKRTIRKGLKVMCREIQMGVASAQLALVNADIHADACDPDRTGVVFGSDHIMTMPDEFIEGIRSCLNPDSQFDFSQWPELGMSKVTPLWLLKYLPNMPASHIAIYNDLRGPNNSLTYREASANLAIGEAYYTIARGSADRMVAGATGSYIHPLKTVHIALQTQLASNGADPEKLARPFDRNRTGMVLGEGAGAIVLENYETARARGAPIWAEIVGCGSSVSVKPNSVADYQKAVRNAIQMALRGSDMVPGQIGHIHAHGLSTQKSDEEEALAIHEVFGDRTADVPVVAAKSYFGNLGAGGGVAELICSVLALRHGTLFPVLNYQTPDPKCPLRLAVDDRTSPGDSVLNISFTMQGQASCVIARSAS